MGETGADALDLIAVQAAPTSAHARAGQDGGRVPSMVRRGRLPRLSLAQRYALASFVVLLCGALLIGVWVSRRLDAGVRQRTAVLAALYVDALVAPHARNLAAGVQVQEARAALAGLSISSALGERLSTLRVWTADGVALAGDEPEIAADHHALARAMSGELVLLSAAGAGSRADTVALYAPVRSAAGEVVAVTEVVLPSTLDQAEARRTRLWAWLFVGGVMTVMFGALSLIVNRGSDTILRQQSALNRQVERLTALLDQNRRLHRQVRQAAGRTTALNEQALRRISADLHDGPAQALAFALLRLDAAGPHTDQPIRQVLTGALADLRGIAHGLRSPELDPLTPEQIVWRAIDEHTRRTGAEPALALESLPDTAPLPIKIALYRTLQEALSNAYRHGLGREIGIRVWAGAGSLIAEVRDSGPGFAPETAVAGQRLGLAGMRERAEMLGGSIALSSTPGKGAVVRVWWPLDGGEDG